MKILRSRIAAALRTVAYDTGTQARAASVIARALGDVDYARRAARLVGVAAFLDDAADWLDPYAHAAARADRDAQSGRSAATASGGAGGVVQPAGAAEAGAEVDAHVADEGSTLVVTVGAGQRLRVVRGGDA